MLNHIVNLFKSDFREPITLSEIGRKTIIAELGFLPDEEVISASGPRIIVKLYMGDDNFAIKRDGTKSSILKPPSSSNNDLFSTCIGLVVSMNRCCYQDERFKRSGPYCRLGDWAIIPRNEGVLMYLKGEPVHIFYDDRVVGTVKDPKNIRRE